MNAPVPMQRQSHLFVRTSLAALLAAALISCGSRVSQRRAEPHASLEHPARDPALARELTAEALRALPDDPAAAERLLRAALEADLYHGPAHNNLGVLSLERGLLYEAASRFEWARTLMPGHPDPRLNLALTLERAGRIDDAIATYQTALEVFPGHIPTTQALARCRLRHARDDPGLLPALRAIALEGDSPRWRAWAQDRLAGLPGPDPR